MTTDASPVNDSAPQARRRSLDEPVAIDQARSNPRSSLESESRNAEGSELSHPSSSVTIVSLDALHDLFEILITNTSLS
jgi:hypothetical protein